MSHPDPTNDYTSMHCEKSLDPPGDPPACPECEEPLEICRTDYAKCASCGWENELDYSESLA